MITAKNRSPCKSDKILQAPQFRKHFLITHQCIKHICYITPYWITVIHTSHHHVCSTPSMRIIQALCAKCTVRSQGYRSEWEGHKLVFVGSESLLVKKATEWYMWRWRKDRILWKCRLRSGFRGGRRKESLRVKEKQVFQWLRQLWVSPQSYRVTCKR